MAFVLVAPTLNMYIHQMEQVRSLSEQVEAARERNAQLEREIAMWEDDSYIQAQARDRLGYVMPGQQPYMVIDPEAVIGEEAEEAYQQQMGYTPPLGPWYLEMWSSIEIAGNAPAEDTSEETDADEGVETRGLGETRTPDADD